MDAVDQATQLNMELNVVKIALREKIEALERELRDLRGKENVLRSESDRLSVVSRDLFFYIKKRSHQTDEDVEHAASKVRKECERMRAYFL